MGKIRLKVVLVAAVFLTAAAVHLSQSGSENTAGSESDALQTQIQQSFGQLPLLFVENQGQWDDQVAYAVQGSDKTLFFTPEGVTFALTAPVEAEEDVEDGRPHPISRRRHTKPTRTQRYTVKLDFLGANPNVQPVGEEPDAAVISYFKGRPDDWHAGLPTYRRIIYPNLWPGIDLVYDGTVNRLKYHFLVRPGADPNQIRLAYRGATSVTLNDAGQLIIQTPLGSFEDDTPVAYQEVDGERVLVDMAYVLNEGTAESQPYHFSIGHYDPTLPLILDPVVLVFSGYLGGSSSEFAVGVAFDNSGNIYVTGFTGSDETTFPVEVGPDLTYNGSWDAFVVKINQSGTELIYAGYIGGSSADYGESITVDESGNAYITGATSSDEATFPAIVGPDLTHNGGDDAFVAKINPTGSGLVFAGYIGGDDDDWGHQLAIDESYNIYLTGWTESTESTFPVIVGPDLTYNGGAFGDAFVTKINASGNGLIYSGYIGGSEWEEAYGIAVDGTGNAYVSGFTESTEASFPVIVGPDLTFNGEWDAFVTKVNAAGTGLIYSGYIGGSEGDYSSSIAVDDFGNAYITGDTASDENSFPVTGGPDLILDGLADGYIAKINTAGTSLVYAGYIGGNDLDGGVSIDVDENGSAYIAGITRSDESSFPVTNGPDLTFNGDEDGFVAKLNPSGANFDYLGYIGGDGVDWAIEIAVDDGGNAYVVGITTSNETTFPVAVGPDLTYNGGEEDGFVIKVAIADDAPENVNVTGPDTGLSGISYVFTSTTAPVTTMPPLTYTWQATGQIPITHTGSLTYTVNYTWHITGAQYITVTAMNALGTVTGTHVITLYEPVSPDFSGFPISGTAPLSVTFTNLSIGDFDTCLWDYGDGFMSNNCTPSDHTYQSPGQYTVSLTISGFGGMETFTKTNYITAYEMVSADFTAAPITGTAPLTATFTNLSTGDFDICAWVFGDGGISNNCTPGTYTYQSPGTYTVSLSVSGLGGIDVATKTDYITVYEPVTANFTATPTTGPTPLSVTFTNLSTGDYTDCLWDFGDGSASNDCNLTNHLYTEPGTYTVSLTINGPGGTDTITKTDYIQVNQDPTIYMPAIFKP